jgi:hypothetical protein
MLPVEDAAYMASAAYGDAGALAVLKSRGYLSSYSVRKSLVFLRGSIAVIAYRGTVVTDTEDLSVDSAMVLGNELDTARFKQDISWVRVNLRRRRRTTIYVVGHSCGASIAVHCAYAIPGVTAYCFEPYITPKMLSQAVDGSHKYTKCHIYAVTGDILCVPGPLAARGAVLTSQAWNPFKSNPHSIAQFLPFLGETLAAGIEYLVVAGGGGSGGNGGGGGGAGGLLAGSNCSLVLGTSYEAAVGGGGAGHGDDAVGDVGSNSTFSTITALGGGGGGSRLRNGPLLTGGSGGGGAGAMAGSVGGLTNYGPGTAGQGFDGAPGSGIWGSDLGGNATAGGGGGAAAAGTSGSNQHAGSGGEGLQSSITGSNIYYAGGGAGAIIIFGTQGSPGLGGGGSVGGNGSNGLGGGGGGGGGGGSGGHGGSGLVVVSIPVSAVYTPTATGATSNVSGSNTVFKFTSAGTLTLNFS